MAKNKNNSIDSVQPNVKHPFKKLLGPRSLLIVLLSFWRSSTFLWGQRVLLSTESYLYRAVPAMTGQTFYWSRLFWNAHHFFLENHRNSEQSSKLKWIKNRFPCVSFIQIESLNSYYIKLLQTFNSLPLYLLKCWMCIVFSFVMWVI